MFTFPGFTNPAPDGERCRASARIEHARVMLALRNVDSAPFPPPAVEVAFNPREILQ
ncbi:hypothetical protein [Actinomadura sp. KC216]|uniref:hypothetical protein n=1 Tax=Actinomadura sp. KC216 TaxID=2530370 RepID=UPI0014048AFA|nr:hypothetical protein [Actinomadura sp. KC216]